MEPEKFYCHGEAEEFPSDEFYRDKDGALIHIVKQQHYAITGDPVVPSELPVELLEEINIKREEGEQ